MPSSHTTQHQHHPTLHFAIVHWMRSTSDALRIVACTVTRMCVLRIGKRHKFALQFAKDDKIKKKNFPIFLSVIFNLTIHRWCIHSMFYFLSIVCCSPLAHSHLRLGEIAWKLIQTVLCEPYRPNGITNELCRQYQLLLFFLFFFLHVSAASTVQHFFLFLLLSFSVRVLCVNLCACKMSKSKPPV